jgi:protoporphyrinogen oxidase
MKYIIIGAGISGLSIAQLLNKDNEVIVLEKDARPGGMIKCDRVEGSLFHRTGGHVFNTKREDVMKWFWSFFNQERDFIKTTRNSSVVMDDGKLIPYPIEYHAYLLGKETGAKIVTDLVEMARQQDIKPSNFEDFLKGRFGSTLYDLYFKPFNWKVWRRDLTKVPLSWLEGNCPCPPLQRSSLPISTM